MAVLASNVLALFFYYARNICLPWLTG